ncbi:hypothetical protein BO99DRAFT_91730 [Aspergillus violaceofuscus CBS 115571]|uniref:Transmembrane protein n=1 Tax=Aspergillus violaceofuscus (strain CBS 115571) TaxID=1450538 RepID=A0A2V5HRU6_ASPV1|nr:hypothetical protein BO99DRAFT_91730 [Aspergillus violaceofuscus CBS 115571]
MPGCLRPVTTKNSCVSHKWPNRVSPSLSSFLLVSRFSLSRSLSLASRLLLRLTVVCLGLFFSLISSFPLHRLQTSVSRFSVLILCSFVERQTPSLALFTHPDSRWTLPIIYQPICMFQARWPKKTDHPLQFHRLVNLWASFPSPSTASSV